MLMAGRLSHVTDCINWLLLASQLSDEKKNILLYSGLDTIEIIFESTAGSHISNKKQSIGRKKV